MLLLSTPGYALTLKIATLVPDGTSWMKAMRSGAKEITRRTEGRIKFRFYPGGVMGNDRSVLRKIRIGQLHGGAITSGGLKSIYPDVQIYSLPFVFRDFQEVDYVRQRMDPLIIDGLRKQGFISYGLSEGGFAYLMSKSRITSVEELRKKKVWTPEGDEISSAAFRAIGVSPIPLPITDVLTGLQTGLIETVGTSPIGAIALQWHTRVKHLTDIPLIYLYATLVISERALKRVSPADRAILAEVMGNRVDAINHQSRSDNLKAKAALKNQGILFYTPTEVQIKSWHMYINDAVDELKREGDFSSGMYQQLQQHLATHRSRHP